MAVVSIALTGCGLVWVAAEREPMLNLLNFHRACLADNLYVLGESGGDDAKSF